MPRVRYRIVETLPERVRSDAFTTLGDRQIRLHFSITDGELTVIATGESARDCEALLRQLGASEIGVELCG